MTVIQHIYRNADGVSIDCNTVNINAHDGSTHGLQLGGVLVTATAQELNNAADVSNRLVNVTASSVTLSQATHDNRIITLNRAAGIAVTLPAATGTGMKLRMIIGTSITSNTTTITCAGSDKICGFQHMVKAGTETPQIFPITATSTVLTLNGTTKGGIQGDIIELIDIATNLWVANEELQGSGTMVANYS